MSMERRAVLAFVLSLIVFLAYDYFYLSPRNEEQRAVMEERARREAAVADSIAALNPVTPEPETVAEGGEPASLVPYESADSDTVVTPATEPEYIVVASDLYEFTLTTAGGEMVSARLLHYLTHDEPVELFPQNPGWTYERAFTVKLAGQDRMVSLNGAAFKAYRGVSDSPLPDGARVQVARDRDHTEVIFRGTTTDGKTVERYYRFYPDRYYFDAGVRFPTEALPNLHDVLWSMGPGLTATENNVKDDQQNFRASVLLGEEFHRLKPSNFGKERNEAFSGTMAWTSLQTKYFMAAIIPPEPTRAQVEISGNKESHRITTEAIIPAKTQRGMTTSEVGVYLGPLDDTRVKALDVGLDRNIEMGWRFIRPVSWGVLWMMKHLYRVIPNYGWVIIIISVLAKVLFYRLTHKSFKSMKDMQELAPRLNAIKEKYKDDRQKVSEETMKLYKEAGVNPLGGCLPMLLQMPVFIALFNVLKFTIEVRGAHWFGWINDLSQQDMLFALPISLPFIGDYFSLLPILMGVAMFMQSKLGGSPTGQPSGATPPGFQTMLPIVFTVLFYKMPSGLVLYWLVNTVLSIAQQYYINKDSHKSKSEEAPAAPARKRRSKA